MAKATHATTKARAPETGTPVMVRFQADPLAKLDAWRKKQDDLPSRPEAIRRLVEKGARDVSLSTET